MSESPWSPLPAREADGTAVGRLGLLGSLYLAQGLPFGFFTQALPVLLREQGASLPAIGLANLLALPWMLKFLWAPLVDRRGHGRFGRRRGFLLPVQLVSVGVLALLSQVDPTRTALLFLAVFACNLLAATQDIATDGLAVDLLPEGERGLGNGVQVAAYRVGMVIGGGALLTFLDDLGWERAFLAMAALLFATTVPLMLYREPRRDAAPTHGIDWSALIDWWRRSDTAAWMLLLFVFKLGDALASGMIRPMMVDAGLTTSDVGWIMGTVGSGMGLVGAMLGGVGAARFGRRRALLLFGSLQLLAVLAYTIPALWPSNAAFTAMAVGEHLFGGMATVALFTSMMDASRPERAATDYTVQACVVVASTGIAAALSGFLAGSIGYVGHFLVSAVVCAMGVGLVAIYRPRGGEFTPRLDRG